MAILKMSALGCRAPGLQGPSNIFGEATSMLIGPSLQGLSLSEAWLEVSINAWAETAVRSMEALAQVGEYWDTLAVPACAIAGLRTTAVVRRNCRDQFCRQQTVSPVAVLRPRP